MADWKTLIGKDWNKTYGLTNTLYVTRNDDFLMDTELVSNEIERPSAARGGNTLSSSFKVIEEECGKLGLQPLLPPLAPFYSQQWPWGTDASQRSGPKTLREALKDQDADGKPARPVGSN